MGGQTIYTNNMHGGHMVTYITNIKIRCTCRQCGNSSVVHILDQWVENIDTILNIIYTNVAFKSCNHCREPNTIVSLVSFTNGENVLHAK